MPQSDSQNESEQNVDLNVGSSRAESYDEGSRSTPSNLPKAAKRTRKKKGSESKDEDFHPDEVASKKKKVLPNEYGTAASSRPSSNDKNAVGKVPLSKSAQASAP